MRPLPVGAVHFANITDPAACGLTNADWPLFDGWTQQRDEVTCKACLEALVDRPVCRFGALLGLLALVERSSTPVEAFVRCPETAEFRIRVERQQLGLASWFVAEVCTAHAQVADEIPGLIGKPWPILQHHAPART